MKIINNLKENHYNEIDRNLNNSDELFIVSPFLSNDIDLLLEGFVNIGSIKRITLITTLKNKSDDLIKKSYSLVSLAKFFLNRNIIWNIHINNLLHGKVYLFKKSGKNISGIITSANFTDAGMSRNHEWGMLIEDEIILKNIELEVLNSASKKSLTFKDIEILMKAVNEYITKNEIKHPSIELDIKDIIEKNDFVFNNENRKYFIKPIGVSEDPILETELFDREIENLHFSKRKPVSVSQGDILICYGVGTSKFLSYYEVVSEILLDSDNERWPYYIRGRNLSLNFGRSWMTFGLFLRDIVDEFILENPNIPITFVGGYTLGALNFGQDKIHITEEFASYIIEKIKSCGA